MKKIVIIGGCGYIGSKLFIYLTKKGYNVDTVDLEWFGNFINPRNFKTDFKDLPKSFFDTYDVVVLLAGHSTVGLCKNDIIGSFKNNVENFIILIQKLVKQKFIYASTYRVYYGSKNRLAKETDHYLNPFSLYDLTKKTIDNFVSFTSLEYYGLRMATVNGFSPNLRTNQIINKMFLNAKSNKKITLFDPNANFSVLGIKDVCRVVNNIILGGDKRGIYNVASFNSNLSLVSKEISRVFKNVNISVEKSTKKPYHIQVSTSKFESAYNFKFIETPNTIVSSLSKNFSADSHTLESI